MLRTDRLRARPARRVALRRLTAVVVAATLGAVTALAGALPASAADPEGWTDMHVTQTVSASSVAPLQVVSFTLAFDCFSNVSSCEDAVLVDQLPPELVIDGVDPISANIPATVDVDNATNAVTVRFTKALGEPHAPGSIGLAEGSTGSLVIRAHFPARTVADGGATVTAQATMTAVNRGDVRSDATVSVVVTPLPKASATKSWAAAVGGPGGPGSADEIVAAGAAKRADVGFANDSNFVADSLTVREPSDPTVAPAARSTFDVLALDGLLASDLAWPAGATAVTVTAWDAGGAHSGAAVPQAGLDPSTDLLADTGVAAADVTGLELRFTGALEVGAHGTFALRTLQRTAPLSGGAPAGTVSNTVGVVAAGTVVGAPQTSTQATATAAFRLVDAVLAATSAKSAFSPSTIPVAGESSTVTISGTSTANVPVGSLRLVDPAPGSARVFADDGLLLAGFGTDGNGAGVRWPAGATEVQLDVSLRGGDTEQATSTVVDTVPALTAPWSDVTGMTLTFTGSLPVGAKATVPYRVVPGPAAVPTDATHPAPVNCVTAQTGTGSTWSTASTPACRTLTLTSPDVRANAAKRLTSTTVTASPGTTTTAVLSATPVIGGAGGNTRPTRLVLTEERTAAAAAQRWWDVMEPTRVTNTAVAAGDTLTVEVLVGGTWQPVHGPVAGPSVESFDLAQALTDAGVVGTVDGVRFVQERPAGFASSATVRANLVFAVRSGTGLGAETLTNCTTVTAELAGRPEATSTSAPACATVTTVVGDGAGAAPLVKHVQDTVTEGAVGTAAQSDVTMAWSTNGRGTYDRVEVSDLADAAGDPVLGQASFWDAFDLVRRLQDHLGPAAVGGAVYDPYLVFDTISAVQVYDTSTSTWRALSNDPCPAACVGKLPAITLTAGDRAVAGAVRLVYVPQSPSARATVLAGLVAAGDWRAAIAPTETGVAAVPSGDLARGIGLLVQVRDVLRSDRTAPVNDARQYNAGSCLTGTPTVPVAPCAGTVVNDAIVRGVAGGASVPVGSGTAGNLPGERSVVILPMSLAVDGTKTWLRADAFGRTPHDLALPESGTPPAGQPRAVLTVTAKNATGGSAIDQLTVTEPATLAGDGTDPFDRFRVTSLATTPPAGATSTVVQVDTGSGLEPYVPGTTDLDQVVQVEVTFRGRITPGATGSLVLGTQLLTQVRGTSTPVTVTAPDEPVTNTVDVQATDGRVCEASDATSPSRENAYACVVQPVSVRRTDALTLSAPSLDVAVTKDVTPASVDRDVAAGTPVAARLTIQNIGNSPATALTLADAAVLPAADASTGALPAGAASPSFYDAVGLTGATLTALPSDATGVRLDVLTGVTFTADGSTLDASGGTWTTGAVLPAVAGSALSLPAGVIWADVVGVRVVFLDDAMRSPGAVGVVTLHGLLRAQLRSGGAPSATGGSPASLDDADPNPGETQPGVVSNTVVGRADGAGLPSSTPTASDQLAVSAGRIALAVGKSPTGQIRPGEIVDFTLTATHTGTADLPDPVVTDLLPTDGTGLVLSLDTTETGLSAGVGSSPWSAALTGPGTHDLGAPQALHYNPGAAPAVVDGVLVPAHAVAVTWPAGAILHAGQTVTITLPLRVRSSALGATSNTVAVTSTSATRHPTATGCTATSGSSSFGASDDSCRATVALSVASSGAFTSRKDVRAWPADLGAVDTRATPAATCSADAEGYVAYPCAALVQPGGLMRWRTSVTAGNVPASSLVLVDVLPTRGDVGEITHVSRGTDWRPVWDGLVPVLDQAPAGTALTVLYATTPDPAVSYTTTPDATWSATPPADPSTVTGFTLALDFSGIAPDGRLPAGGTVRIAWTMRAPVDLSADAFQGDLAWNTFGFRGVSDTTYTSQPRKAGVLLPQSTLTVHKSVQDDTDHAVARDSYDARASCTIPTDPTQPDGARSDVVLPGGGLVTLASSAGWQAVVDPVPVGARCTVAEVDARGASTTTYTPDAGPGATQSAPVDVTGPVDVSIANVYDATTLTVRKVVDASSGVPADRTYDVTLACSLDGDALVLGAPDQAFTLLAGGSHTVTGLPVGADCLVTETGTHGATVGYRVGATVATTGDVTLAATPTEVTIENAFSVLELTKSASTTIAEAGDPVDWTLEVRNTGPAATSDVRLADPVPAGLVVDSVDAPAPWTCTLDAVAADGTGGDVTCAYDGGASLAPGATAPTVTLHTHVAPGVATDTVTNEATVRWTDTGSPDADPTERSDTDDDSVDVKRIVATLESVCRADVPWLDYAIDVRNVDMTTHPVTLSWYADADGDLVPDGPAVHVDTIPAGGDLTGRLLWPGAAVDADGVGIAWPGWRPVRVGETPLFEDQVVDPTLPEYALRAGALVRLEVNPQLDVLQSYPPSTPDCEVSRTPDLRLTKVASTGTGTPGTPVDYTLTVRNAGLGATDRVVLTDPVPAALRVTSVDVAAPADDTVAPWTCAVSDRDAHGLGGTVRCELGGWIGRAQAAPVVTVHAVLADGSVGTVVNTATVVWSDPDRPQVPQESASGSAQILATALPVHRSALGATGVQGLATLLAAGLLLAAGILLRTTSRRRTR